MKNPVEHGDCNKILKAKVLPGLTFENYQRGLCILDPYGLHLHWDIIEMLGKSRAVELFLNLPIMDMNRNALWRNPTHVTPDNIARMNAFWGDSSWRSVAYEKELTLFGYDEVKADNETVARAFAHRLKKVAGFTHVAYIPMKNTSNAVIYYLFHASHKPVAQNIVTDIFKKYDPYGHDVRH